MGKFACCTIVARNYLPLARVLAKSLQRHHPDVTLWVLVIDDESFAPADEEPFSTLSLGDVGLGNELGREMAALYSVLEFSTAVKPWLLTYILGRTGRPVLYFDPDKLRWMLGKIPERKAKVSAVIVHPYNFTFDYRGTRMTNDDKFGVSVKKDDEASKEYAIKLIGWWRGHVPYRKRVSLCVI